MMKRRTGRYWSRLILGLSSPCLARHVSAGLRAGQLSCLVPSARLELAQLSPLPPQDSVSTNFTTTAGCTPPGTFPNLQREEFALCCLPGSLEVYRVSTAISDGLLGRNLPRARGGGGR